MNTSQPVSNFVSSVSYGFMSSADIRRLSAARITCPTTFDSLLNPVPAGLYTAELGQFGDNVCATCGLRNPQCPGHCGHIELPVPCYHPTFLDQVMRLLRSACIYCERLKMPRALVNKYVCKLRLIRYGLIKELADLDEFDAKFMYKGAAALDDEEDSEDDDQSTGGAPLIQARLNFVKKLVFQARHEGRVTSHKTEAIINARRAVVQEFLASITKGTKCGNCQGLNPGYRKDRFVKIFRKPLTTQQRNKTIQSGHKSKDAVVVLAKRKREDKQKSRKRKRNVDEGIADMERTSEEDESEEVEESDSDVEIAGGDVMDTEVVETTTKGKSAEADTYLNPSRVLAQLNLLFEKEQEVLGLLYGSDRQDDELALGLTADMFFIRDVLVPPNKYRPEARTGNREIAESQDNSLYKDILTACDNLTDIQRELSGSKTRDERYRVRTYNDLEYTWVGLQNAVNSLIDRDRNPIVGAAAKRNPDGVKQKLEKKEGMFRKYMMGKRVNFAARTVISPDPNIETNEIGIPPVFAIKLTYPEPVTIWNLEEMQEAVRNGPNRWPGAVAIENEIGQVTILDRKNAEERTALANQLLAPSVSSGHGVVRGARPKKVHRHLNNGDIVIMNRQPTLHKPSMMCHRARVLPGEKTLRMHYANCNTYNADFDGDEMNLHFPQNEIARAEALSIADTDHQYLSATAGNPLRGLIQDHISISVMLTNRDTFFTRDEYMQLLYAALRPESGHCTSGRLETVPPALIKPRKLWSGKQVITSVLKNVTPPNYPGLTMSGRSTTPKTHWGPNSDEQDVQIKDGELMQGILDKKQIGPSSGGFINSVYEAYGHTIAGRLLSVLGRLLTKLLHMRAHSCGVEDLIFTREGEMDRRNVLAGAEKVGLAVTAQHVSLENEDIRADDPELKRRLEDVLRDDEKQKSLDNRMNTATNLNLTNEVTKACLPAGLVKPFPKNQMQLMTASGAKGSQVNANQISCNLGQQVLEGRRVPVMVSGKTLPCFKPFESSVRAGGYIVDRFLTGVRPQEFFFHAMAGREGLIDTAVKTSRSGYLQRCLIKGMEGLKVEYDTSVRDSDGTVVQFLYGEDGLDVAKAKYLSDLTFAAQNHRSLYNSFGMFEDFSKIISDDASEHTKSAEKSYRKTGELDASEPALAKYNPARYPGAMSEAIFNNIRDYIDKNPDKLIRNKKKNIMGPGTLTKKNFQCILDLRYMRSVVEAGEAVGVVAGQSVGEPSTQMTLNTFHLAGHAAKNVTLGIPRLREIVMTASANISTPTMTLRLNEEIDNDGAKKFAKGISRLSLAEVLDKVSVTESVGEGVAYAQAKKYEVKLEFFPVQEYRKEYAITVQDVVGTLEHRFLPRLQEIMRKELKKRGEERSLKANDAMPDVGESAGTVEQHSNRTEAEREDGGDDSDVDDGDATTSKARSNQQQDGYDAYEDDEEQAIAAQANQGDENPDGDDQPTDDETYGGSPRPGDSDSEADDKSTRLSIAKDRENRIKGNRTTNDVTAFSFDDSKGDSCTFTLEYDADTAKVLLLHLVESAARSALVQSVPGISTAMLDPEATEKTKIPHVITAGVNIRAMWDYTHIVHPHYIYTNSIHDILVTYGVEAARDAIVRELRGVFGGHGISVDARHLTLIADFMTRAGGYAPFNRTGYRANTSPFMKMSFETTVGFLRDAILDGDSDNLEGPSSRIVVGRVGKIGTGGFDVFVDLESRKEEKVEVEEEKDVIMEE